MRRPEEAQIEPNTTLQGRYQIVRPIGQGGMGTVYMAEDLRLGNTVALKKTFFTDERMRRAFEREARLLASLRHPALTKVIDHFTEEDGQFLVMEYIPGNDLSEQLKAKGAAFHADEVLVWGDQLLDALDYLHTQEPPIIHRDIKPQNLKLTERGQIILLDFGLAKGSGTQMSRNSSGNSVMGFTPSYSSLEQMQGGGTDPRSDIYSLAATMYHLMTDVKPPDAFTRAAAYVSKQPDPLMPANKLYSKVPVAVAAVMMRAMAQDREERFATAPEMRAALREAAPHLWLGDTTGKRKKAAERVPVTVTNEQPATTIVYPTAMESSPAPFFQTTELASLPPPTQPSTPVIEAPPPSKKKGSRAFLFAGLALLLLLGLLALGAVALRDKLWPASKPEVTEPPPVTSEVTEPQPQPQPEPSPAELPAPEAETPAEQPQPEEAEPPAEESPVNPDAQGGLRNSISGFRAVNVSDTEMRVTVNYTYGGGQNSDRVLMSAYPLQGNGSRVPAGYRPYVIKQGDGTATVGIILRGKGNYTSNRVRVCMYVAGGKAFQCETFSHVKAWSQEAPAAPRNSIRNLRAASVSGTELRVTVDYTYTGDKGAQRIYLSAQALQGDGGETDARSNPFPVMVGDGTATVTVFSRRGGFISNRVKVCMYVGGRFIFYCEVFPYTKNWGYSPPPRNENRNSNNAGPCANTTDSSITGRVKDSLVRSSLAADVLAAIRVSTQGAIVTLSGRVLTERERVEAIRTASQVDCVRRVIDRLIVEERTKKKSG